MGKGKVSIPKLRVEALRTFSKPRMKKELKSYLGMLGYYRRFIPGFSSVALPLTEAAKMKSPNKLIGTKPMEDAFISLRDTLCTHSELTIPSPEDTLFCLQMLLVVASVLLSVCPGQGNTSLLPTSVGS